MLLVCDLMALFSHRVYFNSLIAGTVHFIDFEYAMYSYEHSEVGCHFCEYAGK